jgi:hypothetical protein
VKRNSTLVAAVVGLLVLTACESDPSPNRVAEDIVKAESLDRERRIEAGEDIEPFDEQCMLDVLSSSDFSNDQLNRIAEDLSKDGTPEQDTAEEDLAAYQAALEGCIG